MLIEFKHHISALLIQLKTIDCAAFSYQGLCLRQLNPNPTFACSFIKQFPKRRCVTGYSWISQYSDQTQFLPQSKQHKQYRIITGPRCLYVILNINGGVSFFRYEVQDVLEVERSPLRCPALQKVTIMLWFLVSSL